MHLSPLPLVSKPNHEKMRYFEYIVGKFLHEILRRMQVEAELSTFDDFNDSAISIARQIIKKGANEYDQLITETFEADPFYTILALGSRRKMKGYLETHFIDELIILLTKKQGSQTQILSFSPLNGFIKV